MMLDENTVGPSNPFSTRYVRPGAMAYQFAAGDSAASTTAKPIGGFSLFFRALLDRLRRVFGRG